MSPRCFLAVALTLALGAAPLSGGQAPKEADKDKDKAAKAKSPPRTYTDEDLKKYKDAPKDGTSPGQGSSSGTAGEPAANPRQRRSREYGGTQELPPTPAADNPPASGQPETGTDSAPPATDAKSPEEAEWKGRAAQARRPVQDAEGRIKGIESQIADLRQQLNPMSTTYVLGGNSAAGPNQVLEIEEKLRNLDGELAGAKSDLAEAEKSWQKFLDEARSAGASPAWLKP